MSLEKGHRMVLVKGHPMACVIMLQTGMSSESRKTMTNRSGKALINVQERTVLSVTPGGVYTISVIPTASHSIEHHYCSPMLQPSSGHVFHPPITAVVIRLREAKRIEAIRDKDLT